MHARTRLRLALVGTAALLLGVAAPAAAAPSPTELVADVRSGAASSDPTELTAFDGRLYFVADDGLGFQLFVSDGSVGSATKLDIFPGGASDPYGLTVIGNTLYFAATDSAYGSELWSITAGGSPTLVADLEPGAGNSYPGEYTLFNGDIYFRAQTSVTGQSLFRLSGGAVTQYPMGTVSLPSDFFVYNGYLYMAASGPDDIQLYRADGTNPPTQFFVSNPIGFGYPHRFAVAGGVLYFLSNDGSTAPYNYELYATDGVATPTKLTTDLADTNGYQYYAVFNDTLYFSGGPSAIGRELGHTTGGAAPSFFDINPGASGSEPEGFTAYNGSLYFSADNGAAGYELFSITGAAAPVLRADIAPGATDSYPWAFTVSNGRLVFSASEDGTDWQLHSFDGTTLTLEVENATNTDPYESIVVLGDYIYYSAESAAVGRELWRTRITPAATAALADTGTDALLPIGIAAAFLLTGAGILVVRRRRA